MKKNYLLALKITKIVEKYLQINLYENSLINPDAGVGFYEGNHFQIDDDYQVTPDFLKDYEYKTEYHYFTVNYNVHFFKNCIEVNIFCRWVQKENKAEIQLNRKFFINKKSYYSRKYIKEQLINSEIKCKCYYCSETDKTFFI